MAPAHSPEEWSDPRSNPLELSSSLRSKRLTEGYYASLALVFKLIWRILSFQYGTKPGCTVFFAVLQYRPILLQYHRPTTGLDWSHFGPLGCYSEEGGSPASSEPKAGSGISGIGEALRGFVCAFVVTCTLT